MIYDIPQVGKIEIRNIILDLNGTLAVHGKIVPGVKERLKKLKELGIQVVLFTGDHRNNADKLCQELGITFKKAKSREEKEALLLEEFDPEYTAAIGNARIDNGKFKAAKLAIGTLQSEGIHTEILKYIDVLVPSINDALDIFIDKSALEATMRA